MGDLTAGRSTYRTILWPFAKYWLMAHFWRKCMMFLVALLMKLASNQLGANVGFAVAILAMAVLVWTAKN